MRCLSFFFIALCLPLGAVPLVMQDGEAVASDAQLQVKPLVELKPRRLAEVQARLHAASEALRLALAEQEYCHVAMWGQPEATEVVRLMHLAVAFRREMQCWGRGSLREERLQRWEREKLPDFSPASLGYYGRHGWVTYLQEDVAQTCADYEKEQRRLRVRAAALIRSRLRSARPLVVEKLPAAPEWRTGAPMPNGVQEEEQWYYRLRDAMAFVLMARPLSGLSPEHSFCVLRVVEGEGRELEAYFRPRNEWDIYPSLLLWNTEYDGIGWLAEAKLVKVGLCHRAGVDVAALASPVRDAAEGHLRVEAAARHLRAELDAAETQLPALPAEPDAACCRLLTKLAAHWSAYAYALRRFGNLKHHRGFVWAGGCLGYRETAVWGDAYYLDFNYEEPQEGQAAPDWLRGLIGRMRAELDASLHEHRSPEVVLEDDSPIITPPMPAALDGLPEMPAVEDSGEVDEADWEMSL